MTYHTTITKVLYKSEYITLREELLFLVLIKHFLITAHFAHS